MYANESDTTMAGQLVSSKDWYFTCESFEDGHVCTSKGLSLVRRMGMVILTWHLSKILGNSQ